MASGLSRVISNARTPPATSASAIGTIALSSKRRPMAMMRPTWISWGIGERLPGWSSMSGKVIGKLLEEIVDHGPLLAVQAPARRPASVARDDPAPREDRLFGLDDQLDVLHPVRNVRKQPAVNIECPLVLPGLPRAPDGQVHLGERTPGLYAN